LQREEQEMAKAYLTSQLSLTSLGKAVLAGGADWSAYHDVNGWWGGTHLTEDVLWRWDQVGERLIAPE
jgi:hypothetical protein